MIKKTLTLTLSLTLIGLMLFIVTCKSKNDSKDGSKNTEAVVETGNSVEPEVKAGAYYTVKEMSQGDILCYITMADENGNNLHMSAAFAICEDDSRYLNKKVSIAKTEIANLNDCESNEPCGKTKKEKIIAELSLAK
ncbi:MAG: hypothetical protein GY754_32915 [bacterium]|nr:hypothetical protein [bacterium]